MKAFPVGLFFLFSIVVFGSSCRTPEPTVAFRPMGGATFDSRIEPAGFLELPDSVMQLPYPDHKRSAHALGYAIIGQLEVREFCENEECEGSFDLLLVEAAKRGAEAVSLGDQSVAYEAVRSLGACIRWEHQSWSEYYCPPIGGAPCGYVPRYSNYCAERGPPRITGRDQFRKLTADLWRQDADLSRDQFIQASLDAAIRMGDPDSLSFWHGQGADVSGAAAAAAIHHAGEPGNLPLVRRAFELGDEARSDPSKYEEALNQAVFEQDTALANLLIEHGGSGPSSLYLSALKSEAPVEMLQFLIEAGVRTGRAGVEALNLAIDERDEYGMTLVDLVLYAGHRPTAAALVRAASEGDAVLARVLINTGMNIDRITEVEGERALGDINYRSPLTAAAEGGHTEVVRLLLESGADVNQPDTVELRGPYVSLSNQKGPASSALMRAIDGRHIETVQALVDAGAELGGQPFQWITSGSQTAPSLWLAVFRGSREMVEILLAAGAEDKRAEGRNRVLDSALYEAVDQGRMDLARLLLESGSDDPRALVKAVWDGNVELVQLCLDAGYGVDRRINISITPLMAAPGSPNGPQVIRLLLASGADPNLRDDRGYTALMFATDRHENLEAVRALLEGGADPRLTNEDGETARSLASNREIRALLRAAGG
jgi:ankyrin repeat protein